MPDNAVTLGYGPSYDATPSLEARRSTPTQKSHGFWTIRGIHTEELERIRKSVLRAAFRVTRNFSASCDIAQDIWASLLAMPKQKLDEIKCMEAYAVSAARNKALNWCRTENLRSSVNDTDRLLSENSDPYNLVCTAEEVSQWLEALPETVRIAFILCRVYGYTAEECAGVLEISAAAVCKRVHRALIALRAQYQMSSLPDERP